MKKIIYTLCVLLALSLQAFPQNLVTNGSFENGFTGWNNLVNDGAAATFSLSTSDKYDGAQAMKVVITTLGSNAWSIQSIGTNWAAELNKTYVLSFYAKAAAGGTQVRAVEQNTKYQSKDFTLTTSWQKYEWILAAGETSISPKFHFFQAGTILIDALSITAQVQSDNTKDTTVIDPATTYQQVEGFGTALAFYDNWVVAHPYKEDMYQALYSDLGLHWLRIRNEYRYQSSFSATSQEFVQKAKQYSNDSLKLLMCSWSPPATLKSNDSLVDGTLKKINGQFVYGSFADYWHDALVAYSLLGINPNLISLQNEPDWLTNQWETCKLSPSETSDNPGYDKALDSVYDKIKGLPNVPKMLGAEALGIGYNNFSNYNTPIKNNTHLYGYAYHLYHGGDPALPDSYNDALQTIANNFGNKPNYMTEFELYAKGWFNTAWLINNVLVKANASTFLYWNGIWPNGGLIDMDNPWDKTNWRFTKGYQKTNDYYAMKHFSKHIAPGSLRIKGGNSNSLLRASYYLSPDQKTITAILINTSTKAVTTKISVPGWDITGSAIYQSAPGAMYQLKGALPASDTLLLPDSSVTTIVMNVSNQTVSVNHATQETMQVTVYPNPAKEEIWIKATGNRQEAIGKTTNYELQITNSLGQTVLSQQLNAFKSQQQINISALSAGIYFYIVAVNSDIINNGKLIISK